MTRLEIIIAKHMYYSDLYWNAIYSTHWSTCKTFKDFLKGRR
jgi:hypothetical protein